MSFILRFRYYLLLFFLSFLAIAPLFHAGFFIIHDDAQVARVFEMGKMLHGGVFPVRWVPDLGYGYGYPIFNFYAPFAYYIGGFFILVGFDALWATKVMFFLAITMSGVGMYILAKEFWGEWGGIIAGLLYVYSPYHALNAYVRGDVAELFAYALVPFLFWGTWKLYETISLRYVFILSILYCLLILSHNLSAMMISPFFLIACGFVYLLKRRNKKSYRLFLLLIPPLLGILLSSFYLIPVFLEMKYTNVLSQVGGNANFRNQFVCFYQLWDSPWLYGGSIPGCVDGLSFRIGKLHIILTTITLLFGIFSFKKYPKQGTAVIFAISTFLLGVYLMLQTSLVVWETIPQMVFFQYPWKFLQVTSLASAFLGGGIVWYLQKHKGISIFMPIILACIVASLLMVSANIFIPQKFLNKNSAAYTSNEALKEYASILSDEYLPTAFVKPYPNIFFTERYIVRKGVAQISSVVEHPLEYNLKVTASTPSELLIKLAYFPTWHVFINGEMKEFGYSNRGIIVTLPKGTYNISVRYRQTTIELVANTISIITFVILVFFLWYPALKKYLIKSS